MKYSNIDRLQNINADLLRRNLYEKYKMSFNYLDNIYIFGTGLLGQFVCQEFIRNKKVIQGFVDNDTEKQGSFIDGIKVYHIKEINENAEIVIASLMYWYEIKKQLLELGFKHFFCYEELALALPQYLNYNQSFYDFFDTIERQRDCYDKVLHQLEDEKSKQILDAIVGFRLTLDIAFTKEAYDLSIIEGTQYFDQSILKIEKDEVFLDGGGFDGDSIKNFILWNQGTYKKILFFEPDQNMVISARKNLKDIDRIEYFSKALGAGMGNIRYDASGNQTGGGQIKASGDTVVEMCTIDSLDENITLIKLDTEGFELEILKGAEKTIRTYKPRIVLAVYHRPGDIYDICNYVLQMNPSYKVYMRHYTKVYADTVLYFV